MFSFSSNNTQIYNLLANTIIDLFQDRLRPGRMLLVDTVEKKIEEDNDLKLRIALSRPHKKLSSARIYLDQLRKNDVVTKRCIIFFNYTVILD